jgi:hypothetical protein
MHTNNRQSEVVFRIVLLLGNSGEDKMNPELNGYKNFPNLTPVLHHREGMK